MTHANSESEKDLILIREINNLLNKNRLPLKRLAGRAALDLSPTLKQEAIELKGQLQQYLTILGGNVAPNDAIVPQMTATSITDKSVQSSLATPIAQTHAGKDISPPSAMKHEEKSQISEEFKSPVRRRNKGFDLLLIAAPYARDRYGYPISHDVLFDLAKHYDPQVTRATMVSKVNRYKNHKKWLEWKTSEDIQITTSGRVAYKNLYLLADRDGDLPRVKQTFREKWNIDLPS